LNLALFGLLFRLEGLAGNRVWLLLQT